MPDGSWISSVDNVASVRAMRWRVSLAEMMPISRAATALHM